MSSKFFGNKLSPNTSDKQSKLKTGSEESRPW